MGTSVCPLAGRISEGGRERGRLPLRWCPRAGRAPPPVSSPSSRQRRAPSAASADTVPPPPAWGQRVHDGVSECTVAGSASALGTAGANNGTKRIRTFRTLRRTLLLAHVDYRLTHNRTTRWKAASQTKSVAHRV